jgi:N,N'-diacetylchitobiose transport system substrate-binding protein
LIAEFTTRKGVPAVGLRKTPAALVAFGAAAALAIAGCSSSSSSSPGASSSSGSSSAPAELTVWRLGAVVPSEVTWMNGIETQFKKAYPAYAKTKINVVWIPWTNVTSDWTNAEAGGKNAPDITELGNTETPTEAAAGALANISSQVSSWTNKSDVVAGMLANDTQNGNVYGVPWFGGVRGIWYRTDQFKAAGIASPPTSWAQLVSDAQALQKKYPGSFGIGAPSNDTDAVVSFIWGAGGQVATSSGGKWTATLTSPAAEAGIKFYVSLYSQYHLSPSKYVGQTELGNVGATSGGANEDFALGKLGLYIDGPWASANFPANATDKAGWASFPIPSQNGPNPAPVFAGGSDLGIWSTSKYPQAAWDLIQVMDSEANATAFANLQGFFPPFTSKLSGGTYSSSQLMGGFAKAAANTQISPLNAKNWSTADSTDYVIPTMIKALMQGAPFQATVSKYNTMLQNVLNTGQES